MRYAGMKSGVNGWLLILILGMVVMWPLMSLGALLSSLSGFEQVYAKTEYAMWVQSKTVMWMLSIVSISLSVGGGWRLYRVHSRESVDLAVYTMWIAWPLLSLFMVIAAVMILKDPRAGNAYSPAIYHLVFAVLGAIAGRMYLKRSRRVQNTYRLPVYV